MDNDIAIIGLGATLPGAHDVGQFWADQIAGKHRIAKLPPEIWDVDRLVDPTRSVVDRPYSGIGAVVRGMDFEPRDFGLPPRVARDLDPCQKAALLTARKALDDAGIDGPTDGLRAAVLLGNVQGGSQHRGEGWFRVQQPILEATLTGLPSYQALTGEQRAQLLEELRRSWHDQYPSVTGDSLPGLLGNIIAARIAHYYNFRGPALTIDAACASSLVAVEQAVWGLRARRFDLAVVGGVDFQMDAPTYAGFCAMGALSAEGSFPFDRRANGFVMGEGAVCFVLKRRADVEKDGDFVHAWIHGVGSSSDGRGRALVAPSVSGQVRAMREAWQDAGRPLESLGYVEAHGTATPIGDPTEIAAMREAFAERPHGSIPMGSVKANLGHLKAAAGAVGMLRAVLALREGVVPPQAGFETPNPRCAFDTSPVRIPTSADAFGADRSTAAVSAFGFGGINTHVVLGRSSEENVAAKRRRAPAPPPLDLGIIAFGASSREGLAEVARSLRDRASDPVALARDLARGPSPRRAAHRVAFHAKDGDTAQKALDALIAVIEGKGSEKRLEALGVTLSAGPALGQDAVAFMFPGQGSQYVSMLGELRSRFPVVQETLDEADAITATILPKKLSSYLSPPEGTDPGEAFLALCQTEILQPAMLATDEALRRLLRPYVSPRLVFGHSLGEYAACVAAGVLDFDEALRIVAVRGEATSRVSMDDKGLMLGVAADEATVRKHIEGIEGYLDVVNKNCPTQTIVGGESAAVRTADERLRAAGLQTLFLPVSHAFHSKIVAPVSPLLREALDGLDVRAPKLPILSNVDGSYYPTDENAPDQIRDSLAKQLASPVEFIRMVERAHRDGIRVFVEVGPKRALAGFVGDILQKKPHRSIYVCHEKLGELETLGRALAALVADGVIPYGDARAHGEVGSHIAWRPPYVPRAVGTPVVALPPKPAQVETPSRPAPAVAERRVEASRPKNGAPANGNGTVVPLFAGVSLPIHEQAESAPSFGALDDVAGDPRFWSFVAAQAPALAGFVAASFRAAAVVGGSSPQAVTAAPIVLTPPPSAPEPIVRAAASAHGGASAALALPAAAPMAAPASAPALAPERRPAIVAAPVALRDREHLTAWVLRRVAEVTGYEMHELSLDADLEGELGIDSIRQIEVVVDVRDALGLEVDDGFRMGDYPTLRSLIDYLATRSGLGAPSSSPVVAVAAEAVAPTKAEPTEQPTEKDPASGEHVVPRDVGAWLLDIAAEKTGYTREELSLDADLETELGVDSIRQVEIVLEVRDSLGLSVDEDFRISDYPTLRALIGYVEKRMGESPRPFDSARPANAEPGVELELPCFARKVVLEEAPARSARPVATPVLVLHAGAPAAALCAFGGEAIEVGDAATEDELRSILRAHAPRTLVDLRGLSLAAAPVSALGASALRGVFRLGRALLDAPTPVVRVVAVTSIDGALGLSGLPAAPERSVVGGAIAGAWKCLAREWPELDRTAFELSVVDVDDRIAWSSVAAELAPGGSLELALGGGLRRQPVLRIVSLADSSLEPGSVVVALGGGRGITPRIALEVARRGGSRVTLVGRTALPAEPAVRDRAEARRRARDVIGAGATIPAINAMAAELERAGDLARTLDTFRAQGVEVAYVQADATDGESLGRALEEIRERFGRIDVVLHGAGIDKSRALPRKTEEELDEVVAPKLGPLSALLAHAPDAHWVAFSSVSARFGNAGQIDYGAANDALARAVLARGGTVLDFSAWAEIGMAAPLGRALAERGVDLLAPEPTSRWAASAIASRTPGEWVVAGRLARPPLPVLEASVASLVPGASTVQTAQLELEKLAYLRDHRVRTSGVLPGVVAIAALEQAARTLEPSLVVVGLRDVELLEPLKVFPGKTVALETHAVRDAIEKGALAVRACVRTGETEHHRAIVRLGADRPASATPERGIPEKPGPDATALYRTFFHGRSFQVVAESRVGDDRAWARSPALDLPLGEDLPDPARLVALARELAFQTCGVHMWGLHRELALPVGIGALHVFDEPRDGEAVEALAIRRRTDDQHRWFDVTTYGQDGRVLETMRDVRFRLLAKLGKTTS